MFECSNVQDMWRDSLGAAAGILVPAFLLIGTEILQQINGVPEVLLSEVVL